jgi:hypothetical protein
MAGDHLGEGAEAVAQFQNVGDFERVTGVALFAKKKKSLPDGPPQKLLAVQAIPAPGDLCLRAQ